MHQIVWLSYYSFCHFMHHTHLRLRTNKTFPPIDLCAFFGEEIALNCISMQQNVTAVPVVSTAKINAVTVTQCAVSTFIPYNLRVYITSCFTVFSNAAKR